MKALSLLLSPVIVIAVIAFDARARRAESARHDEEVKTLVQRLPSGDLALSGGARWLRSISLEEPGAAFADGPALPDPDPAGAAMAPPVEVWAGRREPGAGSQAKP